MFLPSNRTWNLVSLVILVFSLRGSSQSQSTNTQFFPPQQQKPIVVAIIDTGLDLSGPEFKKFLWINPLEGKNANKKDDDFNGLVDDMHGWNFVSNNSDFSDHHGHGTHIAGLILKHSASANVKILALKYYDEAASPDNNFKSSLKALEYAIKARATVINYSGGGGIPSEQERSLLELARQNQILVVAAAGNERVNIDSSGFYPASYRLDNVLAVSSTNRQGRLLSSSNFGPQTVTIAALGDRVKSQYLLGKQQELTGTSQATAITTGAAIQILAKWPSLKPREVIEQIHNTGTTAHDLLTKVRNGKLLNQTRLLKLKGSRVSISDYIIENEF